MKNKKTPITPQKRIKKDPLKLLELLYKDIYDTNDRVKEIETQQKELTKLMIEMLSIYKHISELEDKLFKDIRTNELRKPV